MEHLPRVVITDLITEPLDYERSVLDGHATVEALNANAESDLVGRIEDADAIMVYHYLRIGHDTITRLRGCKVIVRPGVGYDGIDIKAAAEAGIPVCNVPDYGTEEVADSAIGMALSLTRGIHRLQCQKRHRRGDWSVSSALPLPRLRGKIFGIIGCGRIGTAVAVRAKAFGFDVVFFDPYVRDGIDKSLGIRRCDRLEDLLEQSYVVSLHCPLTEETKDYIGSRELDAMPRGSYVINTARGGVVNTLAVVNALESGHLCGAGVDVLEHEPPKEPSPVLDAWRDPNHPAFERLLLNPHAAYYCDEGEEEFRTKGAMEVLRALKGTPLRNRVN